jgi:hypothetical protein
MGSMAPVGRVEKVFFVVVALSALWVGSWTYFAPASVQNGIPWFAPPFHARVIGATYLSAAVFCCAAAFARSFAEVRIVMPMIATWTGIIFVVSLLYLTAADYRRPPIWIWLVAYLVYPVVALWLLWTHRAAGEAGGPALPAWAGGYLLVQGIFLTAVGALLLVLPNLMVKMWPWALTAQLAQIYAGPVLSYGVASLMLAQMRVYAEARIALSGMLVFALAVLAASVIHRASFAGLSLSVAVWFASLSIALVVLALVLARGRAAARAMV